MDDEYGNGRVGDDCGSHAAEEVSDDAGSAVGAEHDQARVALLCDFDDAFPGWRGVDREALRSEACFLGKCGAVGGGLFGCLSHLGGVLGVEVLFGDGDESDVCRLPDAEDDGVSAVRELLTGLLDGELGERGTVVGEQDRSGNRGLGACGCQFSLRFRSRRV